MKIAILNTTTTISYSGGVNVQGRMWKEGMEAIGHCVDLLNPWDKFDYESYDVIILLGCGNTLMEYVKLYKKMKHPKIACAPIIDWEKGLKSFKFRCKYFGCVKLRYYRPLHDLYVTSPKIDFFLARSEFEKEYIAEGLNVDKNKIFIVPISVRMNSIPSIDLSIKEDYCLHVSRLAFAGKNVASLVAAAKKYKFKLKLAGTLHNDEKSWLEHLIGDTPNVEYLGWLSEQELQNAYKKAKVFALPSFVEGVGMVALEAAVNGCEIVLTDIGAPKEYYNGRAILVNPYDVDSIGKGVLEAMTRKGRQPELREHILNNYSLRTNMKQMEQILQSQI